jgi:protein gp37
MGQAHRFAGERADGKPGPFHGLTVIRNDRVDWSGEARFVQEALAEPLSWRRPSLIFVNSMSDLFHHSVTNEEIAAVFGVMAAAPRHVFQVLTKRPERMRDWFAWLEQEASKAGAPPAPVICGINAANFGADVDYLGLPAAWPLPNVWIGVSAEDQERWDERKHFIHAVPAAVHFASFEPLLGPIDLKATGRIHLGWAIVGGESGPGSRHCDLRWLRSLVEQCAEAAVPCFVKQVGRVCVEDMPLGTYHDGSPRLGRSPLALTDKKGANPEEWPEDLRVQQIPAISFARTRPKTRVPTRSYRILFDGAGVWTVEAETPEAALDAAVIATGQPRERLAAHPEGSPAVALARAGRVTNWDSSRDAR